MNNNIFFLKNADIIQVRVAYRKPGVKLFLKFFNCLHVLFKLGSILHGSW